MKIWTVADLEESGHFALQIPIGDMLLQGGTALLRVEHRVHGSYWNELNAQQVGLLLRELLDQIDGIGADQQYLRDSYGLPEEVEL